MTIRFSTAVHSFREIHSEETVHWFFTFLSSRKVHSTTKILFAASVHSFFTFLSVKEVHSTAQILSAKSIHFFFRPFLAGFFLAFSFNGTSAVVATTTLGVSALNGKHGGGI